jgi:hypothetical protein
MKRIFFCIVFIPLIIVFNTTSLRAGTVLIGVKFWYAFWDSSTAKCFEEAIARKTAAYDPEVEAQTGKGYLAGPVLGYQTDNRLWSFSIALMLLNSFSEEIKYFHNIPSRTEIPCDVELDRREVDTAIS